MFRRASISIALVAALIGLTLASLSQAQAGSAYIPLAGFQNGLKVSSFKERKFNGVVPQQFDFSCGSAALATLLTYYYERPVNERDVFLRMYAVGDQEQIKRVGFSLLDMKKYLESINLRSDGFRVDDLAVLEKAGVPAIALVNVRGYKHFVVIKSISKNGLLLGDPAVGRVLKSRADFMSMWDKVAFVIRDEGATARKHFNQSAQWDGLTAPPLSMALNPQTLHSFTSNVSVFSFDQF